MKFGSMALMVVLAGSLQPSARAQYSDWQHKGSFFILTSPEGANLPATVQVDDFPLLVRLHSDFFDFEQASADGSDIRFSTTNGDPLPYQIDHWDRARGEAAIWVRVPQIRGNARAELHIYRGKADARSESSGTKVFNTSNGYCSVWHLTDAATDATSSRPLLDVGTTPTAGMIGDARHLAGRQGMFGGENITSYPSGGAAHSTSAWFRAEQPNATIIGWGNEGGGRGSKVRMQFRSPPHVHVDSDFSDVDAPGRLPMGEWIHVVHSYSHGDGRIYINGNLAGSDKPTLNIKTPSRLWLGGWYNNYDFVGDLDEVRISSVARSADWVRLEYENQRRNQTLVGPVVAKGDTFSVSQTQVTVGEGQDVAVKASAGGAQKVYWILNRSGTETIAAVDRLSFTFHAGRVVGEQSAILQFKAIYANEVKTQDIAITIKDEIPEPEFTLQSPLTWDGRSPIEIKPQISNRTQMAAAGARDLHFRWNVSGIATVKKVAADTLTLKRAMNSGALRVSLAVSNGGSETTQSTTIMVQEPTKDPWMQRVPANDEHPVDNQFFARDDKNEGTLFCNGRLVDAADMVFLRLFADDKLVQTESRKPTDGTSYALNVRLKPGLIKYRIEFGSKSADRERVLHTANNLVCGDVYLIDGQSNAEATDVGKEDPAFTSEWIRSYGSPGGQRADTRSNLWANAVCRNRQNGAGQIGFWGLELAHRLVESERIPICIINGAVGGSRIDQHQRNPDLPNDPGTIYGRLLGRVEQAKLTHGVRGILWHQGENDQGADGPTGRFGWETYREYFIEMAAGWQQDYPNLQHMHIFQIWPRACSMGVNGSDNLLREVQRELPSQFSRMSIMSTLGIQPPGGCHFPPEGYAEFARLIHPQVQRDHYGRTFTRSISPPNLIRATFVSPAKDTVELEFDQTVVWHNHLAGQFHFDGNGVDVISGDAAGRRLTLRLKKAPEASRITYVDSKSWSPDRLLLGENGIAALTFCNVPIADCKASP